MNQQFCFTLDGNIGTKKSQRYVLYTATFQPEFSHSGTSIVFGY